MIDFQSSAIAESASHRPCNLPSPGREGRGEGELYCGRQSVLIDLGSATVPVVAFGVPPNALHFGCLGFGSFSGLSAEAFPPSTVPLPGTGAKAEVWMLGFGCFEPLAIPSTYLLVSTNPDRKSTPSSPKSTVDLPLEPLIWVDKRPANAPFAVGRHSFSPIVMRQWERANQKPTEADRKTNTPTVDLGCATAFGPFPGRGNPLWTGTLLYSTILYMASPSKAAGNNPTNQLPFEEALKKLEGIVEAMEADDLPLESLLAKYEEGSRLVTLCRGKLSEAELKIQQLEKNADKEMKLKPFEADETI